MKVDDNLLMTRALHDVVEGSEATLDDIERRFSWDVPKLVASHMGNKDFTMKIYLISIMLYNKGVRTYEH